MAQECESCKVECVTISILLISKPPLQIRTNAWIHWSYVVQFRLTFKTFLKVSEWNEMRKEILVGSWLDAKNQLIDMKLPSRTSSRGTAEGQNIFCRARSTAFL